MNATVYREAVRRGILVNSVDDPPHCDFYFGSVVRRGDLQIAISTAGESPAVAQRIRREIDEQLSTDIGPWLTELGRLRREILATLPRRRRPQSSPASISRAPVLQIESDTSLQSPGNDAEGKVFLVGAGPGDPDLLTVKALRLIQSAEVILHDDLVTQAILELAGEGAEIVNVGKRCGTKNITQEEIHALMIAHAEAGRRVVRLKCGDPLIFGRAAEEMSALTRSRRSF